MSILFAGAKLRLFSHVEGITSLLILSWAHRFVANVMLVFAKSRVRAPYCPA